MQQQQQQQQQQQLLPQNTILIIIFERVRVRATVVRAPLRALPACYHRAAVLSLPACLLCASVLDPWCLVLGPRAVPPADRLLWL